MVTNECPFCHLDSERAIVAETNYFYAIKDIYPVTNGHSLIISKRHTSNYFELTKKEKVDLLKMIDVLTQILSKEIPIHGYNIGFNVNEAGGQTVFHTHIHVIPRITGDMENPKGGIRNIFPVVGSFLNSLDL